MRPTLKEIARIARVSVPTVSMVLNEKGQISEETRAHVKKIIAEVGYRRQPSCRVIGLVGDATSDMISSLHQAAAEYGYDLEIMARVEDARESSQTEARPGENLAGLVVYGGQCRSSAPLGAISSGFFRAESQLPCHAVTRV